MSESKQSKSKIQGIFVSLICLLLLALVGFFLVRQRAARQYEGQFAAVTSDPQEEESFKQERIVVAKGIREKWRPWALQHQDLLRRMRKANPQDTNIALEVFTKLPSKLRGPEAVVTVDDLHGAKAQARFTWQPIENNTVRPGAPSSAVGQFRKQAVKDDFVKEHDVLLGSSVNPGKTTINVWASGRITETTQVVNPRGSGKPVYGDPVLKEIVPPYDFF